MRSFFFTLIISIFCSNLIIGQSRIIVNDLFKETSIHSSRANTFVNNAVFYQLNKEELIKIYNKKSKSIELNLPISKSEDITLVLHQFKVFSDDFILRTSNNDTLRNYKKSLFYRGRLKEGKGFSTIIISESQVYGIISIKGAGNYNLGKIKSSNDEYIFYNDQNIKEKISKSCYTTSDYDVAKMDRVDIKKTSGTRNFGCIKFYLEGDYALYQNKGSNISNTADYMSSLFAEMATLYNNESIDIEIKEIKIWTSPDGYSTNNSSTAMNQFESNSFGVVADLRHLFAFGGVNTGGIAWIGGLCSSSRNVAYSNIGNSFSIYPTYSWSVYVITHETGHNLGSHHTHDCEWGVNDDEQIDDCGPETGNGTAAPCYDSNNPILPSSGTIMSYCHLIDTIGIDFTNGFGLEPGDKIRTRVQNASCLDVCESSNICDIPVNVNTNNITGTSADLIWEIGVSGNLWELEYGIDGFVIGNGTRISNISTTSYNISSLNGNTFYDWYVRTDCGTGNFSNWVAKEFKTVDESCTSISPIVLPYFQDWENSNGTKVLEGVIDCEPYARWYFETDTPNKGRVRWGSDITLQQMIINGSGSLLMDRVDIIFGATTVNYSTLTLDMTNYINSDDLQLNFLFVDNGDESHPNDKVWIRGDTSNIWIETYNIDPGNKVSGQTYSVRVDIDSFLVVNSQFPSENFQVRFGQEDNFPANNPNQDGISFDDIEIKDCGKTYNTPYSNNFSSETDCWKTIDNNTDEFEWQVVSNSICNQNAFGFVYDGGGSSSIAMDDWLFSPGIYLSSGVSYEIKFDIASSNAQEKLEIFLSTDNSIAESLNGDLLFRDENMMDSSCYSSAIEFTPTISSYYFVSFHGYSDLNFTHNLYIDNFSIDVGPDLTGLNIEDNTDNICNEYFSYGIAGNMWHHIYNETNQIIASIHPNGQILGKIMVEMRDGGNVESYNIDGEDNKTIPRYFNIESDNSFVNPVSVILYFLKNELIQYNNEIPVTTDTLIDLTINHYEANNENCNWSDNISNGTTIAQENIVRGRAGLEDYYMQTDVTSFSEFLIRQFDDQALPLHAQIKSYKQEKKNIIEWTSYEEANIKKYILERKSDFSSWEILDYRIAQNNSKNNYQIIDNIPFPTSYYRLISIDNNDLKEILGTFKLERNNSTLKVEKIYPNPTNGKINIEMFVHPNQQLTVIVNNIFGQQVFQSITTPIKNHQKKEYDFSTLGNGIYFISHIQGTNKTMKKLVVY